MRTAPQAKSAALPAPAAPTQGGMLRRKCACGGSANLTGECADCRHKRMLGRPQTELAVNEPGDPFEQEADRVAEQITRMPASPPDLDGQSGPARPNVQRHVLSDGGGLADAPPIVTEALRSSGQAMDSSTQAFFKARFGHDFSRVRIHSDSRAAESVQAHAFTVGSDIVFAAGRYSPATMEGRRLLGHELTHVVQQGAGQENAKGQTGGLVFRQINGKVIQRKANRPYRASILSREEIEASERKQDLQRTGQTEAKVCQDPKKAMDEDNCPVLLEPGTTVTVMRGNERTWLFIEHPPRMRLGGQKFGWVLGVFVKPREERKKTRTVHEETRDSPCRIDVRATDAGWTAQLVEAKHLFIVHVDERGNETAYRGGPNLSGLLDEAHGVYDESFPDWDPEAPSVTVLSGNEACGRDVCITKELIRIARAQIPYGLEEPNSNTMVSAVLEACGVPREKPDVWAPGWGARLELEPREPHPGPKLPLPLLPPWMPL